MNNRLNHDCLLGEVLIAEIPDVNLVNERKLPNYEINGTIFMTNYRLIFRQSSKEYLKRTIDVPYTLIDKVEKIMLRIVNQNISKNLTLNSNFPINAQTNQLKCTRISTKDFNELVLHITSKRRKIFNRILIHFSFPLMNYDIITGNLDESDTEILKQIINDYPNGSAHFPQQFARELFNIMNIVSISNEKKSMNEFGWNIYDPIIEFGRQSIQEYNIIDIPSQQQQQQQRRHMSNNDDDDVDQEQQQQQQYEKNQQFSFILSNVNLNYEKCSSYPQNLTITMNLLNSFSEIDSVFKFRSKNRIPTISILTKSGKILGRAAQPDSIQQKGCRGDEMYLKDLANITVSSKLLIVDVRNRVTAMLNRGRNGEMVSTYENEGDYPQSIIKFGKIENIHTMRKCKNNLHRFIINNEKLGELFHQIQIVTTTQKPLISTSLDHTSTLQLSSNLLSSEKKMVIPSTNELDSSEIHNETLKTSESSSSPLVIKRMPMPNVESSILSSSSTTGTTVNHYESIRDVHRSINDIHIEQNEWLHHIQCILETSVEVVYCISTLHLSVLVHCPNGWDRTAQIISLASIMLDPYYRTIRGFLILIEKEWCSMGYPFIDRSGHYQGEVNCLNVKNQIDRKSKLFENYYSTNENERSPLFLQFLDCVYQFIQQFPDAFEFNENILLFLAEHQFTSVFGTFLSNNEKMRNDCQFSNKTISINWFILKFESIFKNYTYVPHVYSILMCGTTIDFLKFWSQLYRRRIREHQFMQLKRNGATPPSFSRLEYLTYSENLKLLRDNIGSMNILFSDDILMNYHKSLRKRQHMNRMNEIITSLQNFPENQINLTESNKA
ncbi:hypothetical protein SNEBB_005340 [Seison nebaliae]|nr:hypothetical protein SNEBB_005340 [Seison nebaliae]